MPTCEQLNIVTINVDHMSPSVSTIRNIDDLTQLYPNQFDSFKCIAMLRLKDDAVTLIDATCKCPLHIKDELKAEVFKMEGQK